MLEWINNMTAKTWLLIVISVSVVVAIGFPLLSNWLCNKDYNKQVDGSKKTRVLKEGMRNCYNKPDPDMEAHESLAWLKSKQNIFGPK